MVKIKLNPTPMPSSVLEKLLDTSGSDTTNPLGSSTTNIESSDTTMTQVVTLPDLGSVTTTARSSDTTKRGSSTTGSDTTNENGSSTTKGAYVNQHRKETKDVIRVDVKKGAKEALKEEARKRGMNLNQLVRTALMEYLEKHPI